jgi:hypothetical protein
MSLSNFHPGEAVHCYLTSCASSSGAIVDPDAGTLKFSYWPPTTAGVTIATTSGLITTGTSGNYSAEIVPTTAEVGIWHYRWSSTGSYKLAQWGTFRVIDPARST